MAAIQAVLSEEGNTRINCRVVDDLPNHIKGQTVFRDFCNTSNRKQSGYYIIETKEDGSEDTLAVEFLKVNGQDNWYSLFKNYPDDITVNWYTNPVVSFARTTRNTPSHMAASHVPYCSTTHKST